MLVGNRSLRRVLTVAVTILGSLNMRSASASESSDVPSVFPGDALAFVEVTALGSQLEAFHSSDIVAKWLASPQYQRFTVSPEYRKLQAVLEIAERQLGSDVWTTSKGLLSGSLAVAVYPKTGSERPDFLAVLRTHDASALSELRQRLNPIITLAADNLRVTQTLGGIEKLSFPRDALMLARKDNWLVLATTSALLDHAVARLSEDAATSSSNGLAQQPSYVSMVAATDWERPQIQSGVQRLLRAWLDAPKLIQATGGKRLPEKLDNPLGSLLFGDLVEALRTTPFVAATMDVHPKGISIKTSLARDTDKLAERYQAFFPVQDSGVTALPPVPNVIGGFSVYRDFASWYAHREEFLQDEVLPGFDKFEAGLANLLPGRDFSEDVLPLIGRRLAFVAAPQDYSHLDGEPGVKLPGMALVVELAKPDEATAIFQLLFQTIAAVMNIEAGQQGRQPWVVTSELHHGTQISYAKYLEKPTGKDLGIVFNFLPASARVGDRFILSSSLPLCKQLVDGLQHDTESEDSLAPAKTTLAQLRFDSLVAMITADTEFFVGRMTQEGRTVEESRAELAALLDLLRRGESLEVFTEALPQVFQVRLEGSWK